MFADQIEVIIDERVPVWSFTFGIPPQAIMEQAHAVGAFVIGTATCVEEARKLEAAGCDAVVAQGAEAGGHRGGFRDGEPPLIGEFALLPQICDAVAIPTVAAGGIMDGRGVAAALILGGAAAQVGTAFLAAQEAGTGAAWVRALQTSSDTSTVLTKTFSGKPARGLRNEFIDRMAPYEDELPSYPVQNAITTAIRSAAKKHERAEYLSLWAGQGSALVRELSAAELLTTLVRETGEAFASVGESGRRRPPSRADGSRTSGASRQV